MPYIIALPNKSLKRTAPAPSRRHAACKSVWKRLCQRKSTVFFLILVSCTLQGQDVGNQSLVRENPEWENSFTVRLQNAKWVRLIPKLSERSPELATLRESAESNGWCQYALRIPKALSVPRYSDAGPETLLVVDGKLHTRTQSDTEDLGPGDFKYYPPGTAQEMWTSPDGGAIVVVTTKHKWQIQWLDVIPQ